MHAIGAQSNSWMLLKIDFSFLSFLFFGLVWGGENEMEMEME